jgi:hypothetical protein
MTNALPQPEFKGFTITRIASNSGAAEEKIPPNGKVYQSTPLTMDYDASKWIYRFFLKVRYAGQWPPYVFAILYPGETRDEDTKLMPLVPPGFGSIHGLQPVLSCEFDEKAENYMNQYKIPMQQPDPIKKLPLYYGFLQIDYHYSQVCYQPGLHTFEVKLGTGNVEQKVDQWSDVQKYQWIISGFTPPAGW